MAELLNILLFIIVCIAMWQFWLFRKSSEAAQHLIKEYCQRNQLQLVSVARLSQSLRRDKNGLLQWLSLYQFEFSSNGENKYVGELTIFGTRPINFDVPPYSVEQQLS